MNKIEILGKSFIFAGLDANELADLADLGIERDFGADEFIFWEEDPPEWFYVIASGRVKIIKSTTQGKELIVPFFGPGEMFGEVAVFAGKPYPASARTVEPTRVIGIKHDDFLTYLSHKPQVALRIVNILSERLRDAQGRIRDLAGERVEQRLSRIILMLTEKLGSELPFTRQDIADMAGTTVETAIRFMSRLKEGNIIRSTRGKIKVIDERKLRLLSEGAPQV